MGARPPCPRPAPRRGKPTQVGETRQACPMAWGRCTQGCPARPPCGLRLHHWSGSAAFPSGPERAHRGAQGYTLQPWGSVSLNPHPPKPVLNGEPNAEDCGGIHLDRKHPGQGGCMNYAGPARGKARPVNQAAGTKGGGGAGAPMAGDAGGSCSWPAQRRLPAPAGGRRGRSQGGSSVGGSSG